MGSIFKDDLETNAVVSLTEDFRLIVRASIPIAKGKAIIAEHPQDSVPQLVKTPYDFIHLILIDNFFLTSGIIFLRNDGKCRSQTGFPSFPSFA